MKKIFTLCCVAGCLVTGSVLAQPAGNPDMQEAMKALGMLMSAGGNTNQAAALHHRQLKELLPTEFEGMKRTSSEAGKNAAFGMNVVYAEATYEKDGADITVKISDISSMGQFMKMAQFAWTQAEMEKESDRGYERTTKIDGHPAQERYVNDGQRGELQVMVDGRFMVEASGNGIEMASLQALMMAIDLNKLAGLKPEAAPAP